MSKGYLYSLRQQWRLHNGNPERSSETRSQAFIRLYGQTAEFQHIGLDSDRGGRRYGSLNYHAQLYAVFKGAPDGPLIPMTNDDVIALGQAVEKLPTPTLEDMSMTLRLGREIIKAGEQIQSHHKTLLWLNPRVADGFGALKLA